MIPVYQPWITNLEKKYVAKAVKSSWVSSQGEFIERFEKQFAQYIGVKHAIAVNTGTAACHLALLGAGVGPGDEVVIPDLTYVATANAVSYCGAKPVMVDVEQDTWNIDCRQIERAITPKTKAVFAVHLLGNPCNYEKLAHIKEKYDLLIIEDAAEALGASYRKQKAGSWFDAAAFSFFGNKTITTGEGGMVTTNSDEIAEEIRLFKGQGQVSKKDPYYHSVVGYNYRMTNVAAALGCAQLERMEDIMLHKKIVYNSYINKLWGSVKFQNCEQQNTHGVWMFGCIPRSPLEKQNTFDFRPMFRPISSLPMYISQKKFPNSNYISRNAYMLPSYPQLGNYEIDQICEYIR